jgi:hypothetical protein
MRTTLGSRLRVKSKAEVTQRDYTGAGMHLCSSRSRINAVCVGDVAKKAQILRSMLRQPVSSSMHRQELLLHTDGRLGILMHLSLLTTHIITFEGHADRRRWW